MVIAQAADPYFITSGALQWEVFFDTIIRGTQLLGAVSRSQCKTPSQITEYEIIAHGLDPRKCTGAPWTEHFNVVLYIFLIAFKIKGKKVETFHLALTKCYFSLGTLHTISGRKRILGQRGVLSQGNCVMELT